MQLRQHLRDNRLAISTCLLSVLTATALFSRSWRDSENPRPAPLPRPGKAPTNRLPKPPAPLNLTGVAADMANGVAGLKVPWLINDANRGRVIAYFVAENANDPPGHLQVAVQRAWTNLRPKLSREKLTTVHLVVVRTASVVYDGKPPAATDPAVLVHGVVTRMGTDADWFETISEWR